MVRGPLGTNPQEAHYHLPHNDASKQVYVTILAVPLAASAMLSRKPYHGRLRGLVVAFDVGTTYSGISYAILDPGEVPKIQGVTRFVTPRASPR